MFFFLFIFFFTPEFKRIVLEYLKHKTSVIRHLQFTIRYFLSFWVNEYLNVFLLLKYYTFEFIKIFFYFFIYQKPFQFYLINRKYFKKNTPKNKKSINNWNFCRQEEKLIKFGKFCWFFSWSSSWRLECS